MLLIVFFLFFVVFLSQERWSDLDVCTEYTLAEIETATNKWAEESKLGEGAFGQVSKLCLTGTTNCECLTFTAMSDTK